MFSHACFALVFASVAEPAQSTPEPPVERLREVKALYVIVKLYIGEKGPHEAKDTMELKRPIKAKEPTTVLGLTEGKLKFFSYSTIAVDFM